MQKLTKDEVIFLVKLVAPIWGAAFIIGAVKGFVEEIRKNPSK